MAQRRVFNIPTEIVRTVVAVAETGSLTRAAEKLGLSQPALSSHVKRIQQMVGGSLFVRTPNGTGLTPIGELVLKQARKMLEANDQILRMGGIAQGIRPVRLGISSLLASRVLKGIGKQARDNFIIHSDNSINIAERLIEGLIDVACIYANPEIKDKVAELIVNESEEQFGWVRSASFVLSPGAPVPILTWPGDDLMIPALTKAGLAYKIVFNSPDYQIKLEAVEAGLGFAAIPILAIPPSLVWAKEYYLPQLPKVKYLLCVRPDIETTQALAAIKEISKLLFNNDVVDRE